MIERMIGAIRSEKKLSDEDEELLNDLIEEHKVVRATTNELVEARNAVAGSRANLCRYQSSC